MHCRFVRLKTIRGILTAGVAHTLAGQQDSPAGDIDGIGTNSNSKFNYPCGIEYCSFDGNLCVKDILNKHVKKVNLAIKT